MCAYKSMNTIIVSLFRKQTMIVAMTETSSASEMMVKVRLLKPSKKPETHAERRKDLEIRFFKQASLNAICLEVSTHFYYCISYKLASPGEGEGLMCRKNGI
jgi:hypothetical protein